MRPSLLSAGEDWGIPEAVDEGRSGWLVDPSNTDEITATIIELLTSPEKLQRASEVSPVGRPPADLGARCQQESRRRCCEVQLAGGGERLARQGPNGEVPSPRFGKRILWEGSAGLHRSWESFRRRPPARRRAVSCQVSARAHQPFLPHGPAQLLRAGHLGQGLGDVLLSSWG